MPEAPDRNSALELARVTEAAALAAGRWVGRGDKVAADQAAVDAVRLVLNNAIWFAAQRRPVLRQRRTHLQHGCAL